MSQRSAAWNMGLVGGPLMIGLVFAVLVPAGQRAPNTFVATACVFCGIGFASLLTAKMSLFRREQWFTFGSRQMTSGHRVLYRLGYALMIAGCIVALGFLLA